MSNALTCPLCFGACEEVLFSKNEVSYFSCAECGLVFMDPAHLPSREVERERYVQHNNDPGDGGYVDHLMDIGGRVAKFVEKGSQGLDYGCGTAPVLGYELNRLGLKCCSYDPIFFDDRNLLQRKYSFVTCCEAFEHFHRPAREMTKILHMLLPGGVLGIKTLLIGEGIDYERWYYANDWTHVSFLSDKTVAWLAERYCLDLLEHDSGRMVFRKREPEEAVAVAAGVISKDGALLLARRNKGDMAGKWEFPGGKLKGGEAPAEALKREIIEELGITVECGGVLASLKSRLGIGWIELIFVEAESAGDPVRLSDHEEYRWVVPSDVSSYELAAADGAFADIYL